jgi:iron complex outermembrane recepter protein
MSKIAIGGQRVLPMLVGAAALSGVGLAQNIHAQESGKKLALEEIIVTAQKREQSVQDVPVAVTAVTQEMIETNRIFTVNDLSGIAPNTTVRPAAGGVSLPAFSMRGITSYGVVPGSDKQVSIYLDGVYLGNTRGSIFTLPDIVQLEVLRGPQGTLFGRNATAGAISITTRDPAGELGFKQVLDVGNNDHFRSRTTFDTPSWNGFSAYVTYLKEERDGDVKNLGGGTFWDRSGFGKGTATSPDNLRDTDIDTWFAAVAYEPNDSFRMTYKYDYAEDTGSPDVQSLFSFEPEGLGGFEPLMEAIAAYNPQYAPTFPSTTRPNEANNAFHINREQENYGHNLTAQWEMSDSLVGKAILSYRKTELFAVTDISGTSGWLVGPVGAAIPSIPGTIDGPYPPDTRFCLVCSNSDLESEQWSAELQFNYDADFAALTFGAVYFDSDEESGSPVNSGGTFAVNTGFLPADGTIPTGNEARSFNDATSYAGYVHGEFHVMKQLDLVLGYRLTRDEKSGSFRTGDPGAYAVFPFDYNDNRSSYTVGMNYFLNDDILLYAKFDSSYVSGGSAAGLPFDPEEVESWELGMKGDFFDGRLRANVALFQAEYDKVQTAQSANNIEGFEGRGTVVVEGGDLEAEGVELELYVLPLEGLTLGLTVGYVDTDFTRVTDILLGSVDGREGDLYPTDEFRQTLNPEWSGNINAQYVTRPLFDDAYLAFSVTGIWRDDVLFQANETKANATAAYSAMEYSPDSWTVNSRLALREIRLGDWSAEVALWGRNLTDGDEANFALPIAGSMALAYPEERIYGIEFTVEY